MLYCIRSNLNIRRNDMETVYSVFLLLGGIALFLYGINFMSISLEKAAGENLRSILEKMTSKGIFALLIGTVVTALIQSSGATSVMVVGFVNAGLMNLTQGLYVMLGANIGTTITAQIIAFKFENIAPLILFIGLVAYLFIRNKMVKKIGAIILGFGMLFIGIKIMGDAVDALSLSSVISKFLNTFNNPFLSLLFGVLITAIIQSSSASVGILQVIAMSSVAGAESITLSSVVFMILGMNIGAVTPMVISSISGNSSCKRTALAGVLAKVFGVIIFMAVLLCFPRILSLIENMTSDVSRQIANFHLLFNLISSLLLFPFAKQIARLSERIIKPDKEDEATVQKLLYITPETMANPSIAVTQFKREILRMANLTVENIEAATNAFFAHDENAAEEIFEREKTINFLNHQITGALVQLYGKNMSSHETEQVGMMFRVVSDIERIGDHAENIAEYIGIYAEHNVRMSESAVQELRTMTQKSIEVIHMGIEIYEHEQFDRLDEISNAEEAVDDLETTLNENHIQRLKQDECNPRGGVVFTDMVIDLERCSDHAINIAFAINGEKSSVEVTKSYNILGKNMNEA